MNYGIIRGMMPIATDTNDFPSLPRDGKIYVDKTGYVHRMVCDANTLCIEDVFSGV